MIATHHEKDNLFDLDVQYAPRFKRFEGAIGWLDPQGHDHYATHWFVVIGEAEDGKLVVTTEAFGDLARLTTQLVDWKDRLLIKRIYIDDSEEETIKQLRKIDGLCSYQHHGTDIFDRKLWARHESTWTHFRDRETTAALLPVPEEIKTDLMGGRDLLLGLQHAERLSARRVCPRTSWLFCQEPPLDQILRHPLMKALIYVVSMMVRSVRTTHHSESSLCAYQNRQAEWLP
jgi:hypothetical protein